jgi:hypothetical protein
MRGAVSYIYTKKKKKKISIRDIWDNGKRYLFIQYVLDNTIISIKMFSHQLGKRGISHYGKLSHTK